MKFLIKTHFQSLTWWTNCCLVFIEYNIVMLLFACPGQKIGFHKSVFEFKIKKKMRSNWFRFLTQLCQSFIIIEICNGWNMYVYALDNLPRVFVCCMFFFIKPTLYYVGYKRLLHWMHLIFCFVKRLNWKGKHAHEAVGREEEKKRTKEERKEREREIWCARDY